MAVQCEIDKFCNFVSVNTDNMSSLVQRDQGTRVISETHTHNDDTLKLKYTHQNDEEINIQMFDGDELMHSVINRINRNGDFEYDGKYTYDNTGNWIR